MKSTTTIYFLLALALLGIAKAECYADYNTCLGKGLDTEDGCYQKYQTCQRQSGGVIGNIG